VKNSPRKSKVSWPKRGRESVRKIKKIKALLKKARLQLKVKKRVEKHLLRAKQLRLRKKLKSKLCSLYLRVISTLKSRTSCNTLLHSGRL